jgi:hypothetical protein
MSNLRPKGKLTSLNVKVVVVNLVLKLVLLMALTNQYDYLPELQL